MAIIATADPGEAPKQLAAMVLGLIVFLFIGWSLRDLERAKKVRYLAAAFDSFFWRSIWYSAWKSLERKLDSHRSYVVPALGAGEDLLVFAGASAMDRIVTKRNLALFIAYSGIICGCLVLMNDFGTALIFFAAFLVIAYLRSGNFATIALVCAATGFGGIMALRF